MIPKPRRKSAKHRALSASRKEALEGGWLPEWYAAREAEKRSSMSAPMAPPPARPAPLQSAPPARPAPPPPPPNPFDNYDSIRTPEGASWPADETGYSRYMVWRLPVSSGSNRPTPPRN